MAADPLIIPSNIFTEMLAHCRAGCPNEACGILAGKGSEVSKLYKITNIKKSPISYEFESTEHIKANRDMRRDKLSMLAIYHSHPSSPAYPSQTDIERAFWDGEPTYENVIYIIVSLIEKELVVKAFSIKEGSIEEIMLTVK